MSYIQRRNPKELANRLMPILYPQMPAVSSCPRGFTRDDLETVGISLLDDETLYMLEECLAMCLYGPFEIEVN